MKKWSTPKAVKSRVLIEKRLAEIGKSLGHDEPFFAALTFSDKEGVWKVCPCCGGDALLDGFAGLDD